MSVFFYIPTLATGGAEKQCSLVAAGLKREKNVDVAIILDYGDKIKDSNRAIIEANNVPVIALPKNKLKALLALYKLFSINKDALLFTYLSRPNFVGALIGRLAGLKRIYSGIRCGWLPSHKLISEIFVNRILATKTIFNSYRGKEYFISHGFSASKSIVISNAIELWDIPFIDSNSQLNSGTIKITTVGRFMPEKDYHTWLLVIRSVLDQGVNIDARIVGWGREESNVKRWINELGLVNNVTFYPSNYDVKKLLFESDIYLSTSISEGVSNSILEAMNAGLPVVATDVGDNDYLIHDGISGFIRPVKDAAALADAVVILAKDSEKRKTFGLDAIKRIETNHTVRSIVDQYAALIKGRLFN